MSDLHVLVMAKDSPRPPRQDFPIRAPPCSAVQAAELAEAALADTLEAVAACGADRRLLSLDGRPGPWLPPALRCSKPSGWTARRTPWPRRGTMREARASRSAWTHLRSRLHFLTNVWGGSQHKGPRPLSASRKMAAGGRWACGGRTPPCSLGCRSTTRRTGSAQEGRLCQLGHGPGPPASVSRVDYIDDFAGGGGSCAPRHAVAPAAYRQAVAAV